MGQQNQALGIPVSITRFPQPTSLYQSWSWPLLILLFTPNDSSKIPFSREENSSIVSNFKIRIEFDNRELWQLSFSLSYSIMMIAAICDKIMNLYPILSYHKIFVKQPQILELFFHTLWRAYLNICLCFDCREICQPSRTYIQTSPPKGMTE